MEGFDTNMYRILKENLVQNTYMEDQPNDTKIILGWLLMKQSVRVGNT